MNLRGPDYLEINKINMYKMIIENINISEI
jgi:hypothetical protein